MSHQVTAEDIIWTFWRYRTTKAAGCTRSGRESSSRYGTRPFHVTLKPNQPFVAAMDSFLGCPIYPKYYWEGENF
jgi:hypothetical protein